MSSATRVELDAYLEKHDIRGKMKACLNVLLHEMPEDPMPFIRQYFGGAEPEQPEPTDTTAAAASDSALLQAAAGGQGNLGLGGLAVGSSDEEESESEEEEEEDEIGELAEVDFEEEERKKRERIGSRRRNSVSSESFNRNEVAVEFPVHEKNPEQEMSIFNILSQSILLKHLEAGPSQIITKAMFKRDVAEGEVVMKQGEDGDNFYIIDTGTADIYVAGLDPITPEDSEGVQTSDYGGRVQIAGPADSFGELALMYNSPRAATVVARTAMSLWAVDRTTFRTLVMNLAVKKRAQRSTYLEGVSLLSTLTQSERETIIDNMVEETYEAGDVVITQGEVGSKFFIVTEGELVVTQTPEGESAEKEVGQLKEGSYFGEIALLTNQERLATVKAVSKVQTVTIERKVFSRVMGPLRDLLKRNMSLYNSYISLNM